MKAIAIRYVRPPSIDGCLSAESHVIIIVGVVVVVSCKPRLPASAMSKRADHFKLGAVIKFPWHSLVRNISTSSSPARACLFDCWSATDSKVDEQ